MCLWFDSNWIGGWWSAGGMLMMLFMLLFWGIILWGCFILGRRLLHRSQHSGAIAVSPLAIDILNVRYAKGEINRDEFEHMKKDIADKEF